MHSPESFALDLGNGIDIKEGYPELYESFRAVHIIHYKKQATKMDKAIDDMKIDCQVLKLRQLMDKKNAREMKRKER